MDFDAQQSKASIFASGLAPEGLIISSMKAAVLLSIILLVAPSLRAQVIHYDSLVADTVLGAPKAAPGVDFYDNALGRPDNLVAIFNSGSSMILASAFKKSPITLQGGAAVHLYFKRQSDGPDTAWVQFMRYDDVLHPLHTGDVIVVPESGPLYTLQMLTLTVPSDFIGYNAVQFTLDTSAASFYIDAMSIMQSGSAAVEAAPQATAAMECFPNPFRMGEGTSVKFSDLHPSDIIVTDLMGCEVASVYVAAGAAMPKINVRTAGTYFVRRRVGSEWVGAPIRIVAE